MMKVLSTSAINTMLVLVGGEKGSNNGERWRVKAPRKHKTGPLSGGRVGSHPSLMSE